MVYFHLKTKNLKAGSKINAGKLFADDLIDTLYERDAGLSKLKLVVAPEYSSDYPLIFSFVDRFRERNSSHLLSRIGFDIAVDERVSNIQRLWEYMFENSYNVWQGNYN